MSLMDKNASNPLRKKRVAIVIANACTSTVTGWPVGFWWSELSHPYYLFTEAGYEVAIFSPAGGACQADAMSDPSDASGYSSSDLISRGFIATPELNALVAHTRPIETLELSDFDALLVAGGQAPMFNFEYAQVLQQKFVAFYEAGKIVAALCHGVAVLAFAKGSDGHYLAKGKTVTGFANVEEDFADDAVRQMGVLTPTQHLMPWRIEDRLKQLGANYIQAGCWRSFAVRDQNLITGQQNFSGEQTARLVIEALGR